EGDMRGACEEVEDDRNVEHGAVQTGAACAYGREDAREFAAAEAKHRVAVFNGDMKRGSKQVVELRAYSQVVLEKILGTAGDGTPGFVRKDEVELGDGRAVENGGDGDGVCRGFKRKPGAERVVGAVFDK